MCLPGVVQAVRPQHLPPPLLPIDVFNTSRRVERRDVAAETCVAFGEYPAVATPPESAHPDKTAPRRGAQGGITRSARL